MGQTAMYCHGRGSNSYRFRVMVEGPVIGKIMDFICVEGKQRFNLISLKQYLYFLMQEL
uniref:Uncharacterized protein n=1 Tax=Lepeophtheirus salmonis TaxID=72036 RepID=A0A0K2U4T7_LEPSM